jgi:hypothetical protein
MLTHVPMFLNLAYGIQKKISTSTISSQIETSKFICFYGNRNYLELVPPVIRLRTVPLIVPLTLNHTSLKYSLAGY